MTMLRALYRRLATVNYRAGRHAPDQQRFLTLFFATHNWCGTKCRMCHHILLREPPHEFIALPDFHRLARNVFPHVREIAFSPVVEPLEHPHFLEILAATRNEYEVPLIWMMTNAMLLTERIADGIIDCGVEHLQVSLDSHRPEIYSWVKTNAELPAVLENLRRFRRRRDTRGDTQPSLEFNFVIMKKTVAAYDRGYMELLHDLGATKLHLWHACINKLATNLRGQSMWEHQEEYNAFHDRVLEDAAAFGIEVFRIPEPFGQPPAASPVPPPSAQEKCTFPWHKIQAYHDGSFTPCEFWFNEQPWGNLIEQPFMKIWNGLRYRKLRWELMTGQLTRRCCRNCVSMADLSGRVDAAAAFAEIDTSATDPVVEGDGN